MQNYILQIFIISSYIIIGLKVILFFKNIKTFFEKTDPIIKGFEPMIKNFVGSDADVYLLYSAFKVIIRLSVLLSFTISPISGIILIIVSSIKDLKKIAKKEPKKEQKKEGTVSKTDIDKHFEELN